MVKEITSGNQSLGKKVGQLEHKVTLLENEKNVLEFENKMN